jgi:hypothetical protein
MEVVAVAGLAQILPLYVPNHDEDGMDIWKCI